jgi:hypothetical protein
MRFARLTPADSTIPATACTGDANADSAVGLPDIAAIVQQWTQTITPPGSGPALDASGQVGLRDISVVITNWGQSCGG